LVCSPNEMALAKVQPDPRSAIHRPGMILVALFAIIPLAIAPRIFLETALTPKLAVAFLGAVCLLICTECWWPGVQALARTTLGRLYLGLLIAQVLSLCLSAAFSGDWRLALFGTTARRLGAINQAVILFLTLVAASYSSIRREVVSNILLAVEVAGGLAASYGILQYFGWDPLLPAEAYNNQFTYNTLRIPGTFGHAMVFANFLLPVVLIATSFFITESRAGWRRLHGAILSIATTAMVLSGTRSALLGLSVGGCLLLSFHGRGAVKKKALALVGGGGLALALSLTLFAQLPAGRNFRVRMEQWSADRKGGPRLMVWRDSIPLIRDHWLAGIGPEQFAGAFRKVESLHLARAYPDQYHEVPHNLLLEFAVNQGMIGETVLIGLLGLALFCGLQQAREGNSHSHVLLASLAGSVVSLQFAPLAFANVLYMYLFAGLLVGLASPRHADGVQSVTVRPFTRLLLTTAALGATAIAVLYISQDFYFAATEHSLAEGDLERAGQSFRAARRFPFPGPELSCSREWAVLAKSLEGPQREVALANAKKASADAERSEEENFDAYYQSAVLAIVTQDYGEAERKLRDSIAAAPRWYRPRVMLANLLRRFGRTQEAEKEAALALECAGSRENQVKLALERSKQQMPITATEK
jgi:O-antigen ligase